MSINKKMAQQMLNELKDVMCAPPNMKFKTKVRPFYKQSQTEPNN